MSNFESGVKSFIQATAKVYVNFPVDFKDRADISCYQCKFFSRTTGICQLTKEFSEYPQNHVGSSCPLEPLNLE